MTGWERRFTGNCSRDCNLTMVYAQARIRPRKRDALNSLRFWDRNRSPNLSQKTRPRVAWKKEHLPYSECWCFFGHQIKNKRKQKMGHVLGICQRTKRKLWNMRVMVIPIVIGALGTVSKSLGEILKSGELIHSDYNSVRNGQNTEKSRGDMRRHVVA